MMERDEEEEMKSEKWKERKKEKQAKMERDVGGGERTENFVNIHPSM